MLPKKPASHLLGAVGALALLLVVASEPARITAAQRASATAATAATFELTIDSIMKGPKLVGYPPNDLRWSGDSSRLFFEWRRPDDKETSTWVVNKDGGNLRQLSETERRAVPTAATKWDTAHRRALFVDDGDIALVDATGVRRTITRTVAREANPRWARSETAVTFTRENNLYLLPIEGGAGGAGGVDGLLQLTDVQARKTDPRESESQKALKTEQQSLFEFVREANERKTRDEEKTKARALPKFELRDRQSVSDLQLMPDGRHALLLVVERVEAKRPDIAGYVTQSGYPEATPARAFVGDSRDKQMLAVLNLEKGTSVFADAGFAGESREVNWAMPIVSRDGSLVVTSVRATNNKDRWVVAVDPDTGKTRVVDSLHDDAWVRELGATDNGEPASFGWMADQRNLWLLSERDGWNHLYVVDAVTPGATPRQLTSGRWEVSSVEQSLDRKTFFLTTSEANSGERHLYRTAAEGGERVRLTMTPGSHEGIVSPDGTTIGEVFSYTNKPPDVYLMANRPGAPARQISTSPVETWRSFKWVDPAIVTYKTRDGLDVTARLYTPEMVGARRDPLAPAVVFVHGAGYLQNAHKYWSTYFREYMFNQLLASRGYVVLDPDFRASSGYGRDWRTSIYRHMGGKDLDDVVDGAKYLVESQKVSARRIGLYGGSYGGFITLMALFTSPDTFAAGAALRPVTDWAHYNHAYTSNILNEPQSDPEAYRRSSPLYFADGLKGALLICHGMMDSNVLFQDSVRLAQRLIELRKENWELAAFPVENHGFEEEASWADEYKRVLKLFETVLKGKL